MDIEERRISVHYDTIMMQRIILYTSSAIILSFKIKTQYVKISNVTVTSILYQISGQSTPMVKRVCGLNV